MFVLDTDVLSALMRAAPEPAVAAWINDQHEELLFSTAISRAEILTGLAIMPDGDRRRTLTAAANAMFDTDLDGRILPFDVDAAEAYASIFAARRSAGRPGSTMDLMIASIALSNGASVVTRDMGGFAGCGVTLINPWAMP